MEMYRYIGVAFGLANVLIMMHTTDAELQAIKYKTQNITESIVGNQTVISYLILTTSNTLDDLIKYDFWVVSPKAQVSNVT